VSIICAFHQAEDFLAEAVESVLSQDYPSFELLLVDDGCTDSSTAIALGYAQRFPDKIRYLDHSGHRNLGVSPSRNAGLKKAIGEFIAFIDSDDRWRPHKLTEQVEILRNRPEVGMVCGVVNYWSSWSHGRDRMVPTGSRTDAISAPPNTIFWMYPLGFANSPCPSDVLLRRDVVGAIGGFEDEFSGPGQIYEDQAFFMKVYMSAPVYFSGRTWLDYRLHRGSAMAVVKREGLDRKRRLELYGWFSRYLQRHDVPLKHRLVKAVALARWEFAHPWIGKPVRLIRRLWRNKAERKRISSSQLA